VTLYFPVYVISEPVKGLSGGGEAFVPELYSIFNNRVYKACDLTTKNGNYIHITSESDNSVVACTL
jgi:hypothetical protein